MTTPNSDANLLDEYDFRNAVRGKYAERYAEGTNVIVLAPDVATAFPTSTAVNAALRALIRLREELQDAAAASLATDSLVSPPTIRDGDRL